MRDSLINPYRGTGLGLGCEMPISDSRAAMALIARCPAYAPTPLRDVPALAALTGVAQVLIKDERDRMGLGSFKALGAAHAIAQEAVEAGGDTPAQALQGRVYVCASAGNHGLSVAAGARIFGARAVIYLAQSVPEAFEERLRAKGAEVVRAGETYEQSMAAAQAEAQSQGWTLLSDSTWPGYITPALRVMEGYLVLAHEMLAQLETAPTHVLLQAGVGGLAAAVAAFIRANWGAAPQIIVVEPDAAPALIESIRAGHVVTTSGPVSMMGRLDCKTPSMVALAGLARDADRFVTLSESEAEAGVAQLAKLGLATTASGGAGLCALIAGLDLGADARVLAILSETREDG
ncbi:pyridoxal-phosphate dependent enzyme [Thioclava sp. 15-R06ZXC-3]|uniref:Pyridoxal-phosphate dependent enzyme n=1 Tax=Thioclava arctica TaxID=3238301 RepID=A0ABV3TF66_9RHOB